MAYARVQTTKQSPTAATRNTAITTLAESFGSTPSVGNLLIAVISHFHSASDVLSSVTDNQTGNTWTIASPRPFSGNGHHGAALAYCIPASSSGTFTVTAH